MKIHYLNVRGHEKNMQLRFMIEGDLEENHDYGWKGGVIGMNL